MSSEELPDDMIFDILSGLPAKSLLRFRCVSKSWRSLIDNPKFIKMHIFRNRTKRISVFHVPEDGFYPSYPASLILNLAGFDLVKGSTTRRLKFESLKVKVPLPLSYMRCIRLVGSFDGLICYQITFSDQIVLVNPFTGEVYFISPPKTSSRYRISDIGLGYDQITDGYKVVLMQRRPDGGNDVDINIYDFKSKAWTTHNMEFPRNNKNPIPIDASSDSCCINGGIHWLVFESSFFFHIVTFDLAREKLMVAEYDGEMFRLPTSVNLRVLGGYLSLCCKGYRNGGIRVDIWLMKEYGVKESWLKLVSFKKDLMPLALSDCGRRLLVELKKFSRRCRCRLHLYDLDKKSFQCTDHRTKAREASGFYYVCGQSLIRLEKC